ncbi:MAG: hypothetical protein ACRDK5_05070 [Solirubrobacterales bacterium]
MSERPFPRVARHWPAARHGTLSRFRALAGVVREHEDATGAQSAARRARDVALYECLDELERSLPLAERSTAQRYPLRGH